MISNSQISAGQSLFSTERKDSVCASEAESKKAAGVSETDPGRKIHRPYWALFLLGLFFLPLPGLTVLKNAVSIFSVLLNALILFLLLKSFVKNTPAAWAAALVLDCFLSLSLMMRLESSALYEQLLQVPLFGPLDGLMLLRLLAGGIGLAGSAGLFVSCLQNRESIRLNSGLYGHSALLTFVLTLSFWITQSGQRLYMGVDNPLLSQVTNGCYGTDNTAQFVSPVLSWIVRLLNGILPGADGLMLYYSIVIFLGTWMIFFSIRRIWKKPWVLILFYFLLAFLNTKYNLFHANFTRVTAWCMLAARMGWTACILRKGSPGLLLFAGLEFLAGSLIRFEACLLCVPFLLLDGLYFLLAGNRKLRKNLILPALMAVSALVFAYASTALYFSPAERSQSLVYDESRSAILDYETKDYSQVSSELASIGMSSNDLSLLKQLFLADTVFFNAQRLAETADTVELELNLDSAQTNILEQKFYQQAVLVLPAVLLSLFYAARHGKKRILTLLAVVCAAFGAVLLMLIFAAASRLPARVCFSIDTALYGSLFFFLSAVRNSERTVYDLDHSAWKSVLQVSLCGFLAVILGLFPLNECISEDVRLFQVFKARKLLVKETEDAASQQPLLWNTMLLDRWMDTHFWYRGYLPDRKTLIENLPDGEWVYGQNYFNELLAEGGWGNPLDLVVSGQAGYVSEAEKPQRLELLRQYILEHYAVSGLFVQTGLVDDVYPIWQFVPDPESAEDQIDSEIWEEETASEETDPQENLQEYY